LLQVDTFLRTSCVNTHK